jgi:hypothetical protein
MPPGEADDATNTSALALMKRDAQWLKITNQQFEYILPSYKMIYFQEMAGDMSRSTALIS